MEEKVQQQPPAMSKKLWMSPGFRQLTSSMLHRIKSRTSVRQHLGYLARSLVPSATHFAITLVQNHGTSVMTFFQRIYWSDGRHAGITDRHHPEISAQL